MNEDIDTSSAAMRVGHESASQYTRLFGAPPLQDIRRLTKSCRHGQLFSGAYKAWPVRRRLILRQGLPPRP